MAKFYNRIVKVVSFFKSVKIFKRVLVLTQV